MLPPLAWSAWEPLLDAWRRPHVPSLPGLYRIRRAGRSDLDYIGQTGRGTMTLRKRIAMLKGVYGEVMPYRDPHTAGPALWALRQLGGELEVSVAPVEGTVPWRLGREAVEVALYRQDHGRSPTVSFGRMPVGFKMSSANNSKLAAAGRRHRGGPTAASDASHQPSLAPLASLDGDVTGPRWCGHRWSSWTTIDDVDRVLEGGLGLYRIRSGGQAVLLYVGQGVVADRLRTHAAKVGAPEHRQGEVFAAAGPLEFSATLNDQWLPHQRLELETDLIAASVLATGEVPAAQFLG